MSRVSLCWFVASVALVLGSCAGPSASDSPEGSPGESPDEVLEGVSDGEGNAAVAELAAFDLFDPGSYDEDLADDSPVDSLKNRRAPACGQPIPNGRGGHLGFDGVLVYSNGACQGSSTSCARPYTAAEIASRRNAAGHRVACLQEEGALGNQPPSLNAYDNTRPSGQPFLNRWQCTEFVKRVFAQRFNVHGWGGDGGQMLEARYVPRGVVVRRQGDPNPPVPGDAVIYGGGAHGHVALVSRVDLPNVYIVGQNEATFERRATWRNGVLSDDSFGMRVAGWAHAVSNPRGGGAPPAASPAPAPDVGGACNYRYWNCTDDRRGRFRCANGRVSQTEGCAHGCVVGPAGQDDTCAPPPAQAPPAECEDRRHRYYECSEDGLTRFRCVNGRWDVDACPHGCNRVWWDDTCKAPPRAEPAPAPAPAPGAGGGAPSGECHYRYWNCTADRGARFRCANGRVAETQRCDLGCRSMPNGQDDVCADDAPRATPVCANTCEYANDGECDDGGPGSLYSVCPLGTDCADCGRR